MSTRGAVGVGSGTHDWRGIAHGHDAYPEGLGVTVMRLIHERGFDGVCDDIEMLLAGVPVENPVDAWGAVDGRGKIGRRLDFETASTIWHEYIYVLDRGKKKVLVLSGIRKNTAWDYREPDFVWTTILEIDPDLPWVEILDLLTRDDL